MNKEQSTGKVIIAGAGPGDAELITVKLQKRLAEADVILADRLVNPEIIDLYARKDVLALMTGKQGYHDGSVAQEDINKLLVNHAKNGKTVLRLKGGDVAFFSNVLDELMALQENAIAPAPASSTPVSISRRAVAAETFIGWSTIGRGTNQARSSAILSRGSGP